MNKHKLIVSFHKVGTTFDFNRRRYIVVKQTFQGCLRCRMRDIHCTDQGHEFSCFASDRADNESVRYDYARKQEEQQ